MKNICERDGLSRDNRRERSSTVVPLKVLEDHLPALLSRVLAQDSAFASYYADQPLTVLSEIENFDIAQTEELFHRLKEEEQRTTYLNHLFGRLDDWKRRLAKAGLEGGTLTLSHDINRLSADTTRQHQRLWFLSSMRMLQSNKEAYRAEIYSSGMVDPSLALIVATLTNYAAIAGQFNRRWHELSYIYIKDMLGFQPRPATVPTSSEDDLLSESLTGQTEVESAGKVVLERNTDLHPASDLGFVTSISRIDTSGNECTPVAVGVGLQSGVLLLREGERHVFITFKLSVSSSDYFKNLISSVCSSYSDNERKMSHGEAMYKILDESFVLEATIGGEWRQVCDFRAYFRENERSFVLRFHLGNEMPPLEPLEGDEWPSIRLSANNTAWLYPYSWACKLFAESVHIRVEVRNLRDIRLNNELGPVDPDQPFVPFGPQPAKGSWLVFGSHEMACKHITRFDLSFDWQQLPDCAGGMAEHYRDYQEKGVERITNRSFRVKAEYLRNHEWKPVPEDPYYLFRTQQIDGATPEADEALSTRCVIAFNYDPGRVRPEGYRLTLISPDMGFGAEHYRRLFAGVVMHNGRSRKKRPVPNLPVVPLASAPRLSYTAEEVCRFGAGQSLPITITYIDPLQAGEVAGPDMTCPVALFPDLETEANLAAAANDAYAAATATETTEAREAETDADLKTRFAGRVSHRNRALLPADYEQLVLDEFPGIVKVKCLPGVDVTGQGRRGVVTLALIGHSPGQLLPLCSNALLGRVKAYLRQYTPPFVGIDVVNPVYEEVTVFCGLSVARQHQARALVADVSECITDCIAPWYGRGGIPVFGYSFAVRDLIGRIRGSEYAGRLYGVKFACPTRDVRGAYHLNKGISGQIEEVVIAPSNPWAILVPASRQHVVICKEEEEAIEEEKRWRHEIEFGDLEVDRTFIIG